MLELTPTSPRVITCLATEDSLGAMTTVPDTHMLRVAPGERVFLCPESLAQDVIDRIMAHLAESDPDGMVVDQSDGWSVWILRGRERDEVIARLSVLPLPEERPAFLQGAVAQVQARILLGRSATCLMVPAPVGHHVESRIVQACRDLEARVSAAESFELSLLGTVQADMSIAEEGVGP